MCVAVFSYNAWAARFPELAGSVSEQLADLLFSEANLLLDNTDCSPVQDCGQRLVLLNLIVAHLAATSPGAAGSSGLVGRVSSATEGSVSVSTDYGAVRNSQAYWVQTGYGAQFWQMMARYRTMHYRPARPRNFGPFYGGGYPR